MTVSSIAQLNPLTNPDGSATYSRAGYTILTAVNGPIEVQRKNELPEEACLEVNIRPASGVGSPRERHLESILQSVLRRVVLVREHPRTLIQVTCQVLGLPAELQDEDMTVSGSNHIAILPALLQSSILALLAACIPLSQTLSSTIISLVPHHDPTPDSGPSTTDVDSAANSEKKMIVDPSPSDQARATSTHVLAFSSLKQHPCLLSESEGSFELDEYEDIYHAALSRCCKSPNAANEEGDMDLDEQDGVDGNGGIAGDENGGGVRLDGTSNGIPVDGEVSELGFLNRTVRDHVVQARAWKG